jgi:hypothetical protein
MKFHENPSSGSRVVPCGQTEGRTDSGSRVVPCGQTEGRTDSGSRVVPCGQTEGRTNIIIIIIYLTANGLSPGGSGYNACT